MQRHDELKTILSEVLGIGKLSHTLTADSALISSIPEFDSISVVSLVTALETYYGIIIEDDDICAETFETLGSLSNFVTKKLNK